MSSAVKLPIPGIMQRELSAINAQLSREAVEHLNVSFLQIFSDILADLKSDYNLAAVRRLIVTAKMWLYGVSYFIAGTTLARGRFCDFGRPEDGALHIKYEDGPRQHDALAYHRAFLRALDQCPEAFPEADIDRLKVQAEEQVRILQSTIRTNTIPAEG